ncbi:hypothetical protein [Rothia sp. P7208]|uniref:hypothetical protein n=1 Tax=Rothia sp. P7208 TaxID=3402660 RepID=UPI003AC74ABA
MTYLFAVVETAQLLANSTTQYNQDGSPTGSPGFLGFVATFTVGVFIILLMLDFTRRVRRMRYRNQYAMEQEAQQRQQSQTGDNDTSSKSSPTEK